MPTAYAYGRISTSEDRQAYSKGAQEAACRNGWKLHTLASALPWGGFFFDPDTSGGTKMLERIAGRTLNQRLVKGDHLFIAKVDRAFRSHKDQVITTDALLARGVILHFLDINLDTSTSMGELMLNIVGSIAQWERRRISERTSDGLRERIRRGQPIARSIAIGWKIDGRKRDAIPVPYYYERELCREIVELKQQGKGFWEIAAIFEREKRPRLPRHRVKRKNNLQRQDKWSVWWLQLAYYAYKRGFPCKLIENRQRWLREVGLMRPAAVS